MTAATGSVQPATTFPPDRTALLVIDPVNDFLSKGGASWGDSRGRGPTGAKTHHHLTTDRSANRVSCSTTSSVMMNKLSHANRVGMS